MEESTEAAVQVRYRAEHEEAAQQLSAELTMQTEQHLQYLVGAKVGARRMRGNWGMNSWKVVVHGRCAGSL